ncbi:unnamed protein product [Rotaria magnacalcarata]
MYFFSSSYLCNYIRFTKKQRLIQTQTFILTNMACVAPLNLCATCETLGNEHKSKPGILLCMGCQKHFCSKHMIQHRENLADLLENGVVCERNALLEKISVPYDEQWSASIKVQLETINNWELDSIELIKQSAMRARKELHETASKEYENSSNQFSMLSNELNALLENESYFENDIDQLKNKFHQLKHDLEQYPVELSINGISNELVVVKSIVKSVPPVSPSYLFVDQLLKSQKPRISINISNIEVGKMCPISDHLIAFHSKNELPALDISNVSWKSLPEIPSVAELHWVDHLKLFLALEYSGRNNQPNKLYQFDPYSGHREELFKKSIDWRIGRGDNFTTLTCFKQYIVIIFGDKIETWTGTFRQWYTSEILCTRWGPPISCQKNEDIQRIRMNDLYYALIVKHYNQSPYLDLRNHGMSTLHRIILDQIRLPADMRLLSLPNASGWLIFFRGERSTCCVFDNNGKRHDQNIVMSSNITDVTVQNDLIIIRKFEENGCDDYDFIEVYDWQK